MIGAALHRMRTERPANVSWSVSFPIEQGEVHVREAFL